jgi:predicted nucleotidyltransferase
MEFGISKKNINEIKQVFSNYADIKEVILYGSRALGKQREGSDIDITFIGKNLDLNFLNKISIDLDDLLLPYKFDLSIFSTIDNIDLLDHIERVGIEIFSH